MSQLLGISSFCGEHNLSGYQTLRYLPTDYLGPGDYEEIISSAGNFQKVINADGGAWLTLPYLPVGSDAWQQDHRKGDQGDRYPQRIEGMTPKLRPEVDAEWSRMANRLFLVHLSDRNGFDWLIGRASEPLEFSARSDSGGRRGGMSNYRFQFSGVTSLRAFGYNPQY